jgi:hypothetical protein
LDAFGEGTEIADALELIIGQLDVEMMFEAREQVEGLEAVDAERLEEIVAGMELRARNLEMIGGEGENFFGCVIQCAHAIYPAIILTDFGGLLSLAQGK